MINFGEFLLVQVLANNAAKDSSDLVSKLRSCHYLAQTKADKKHLSRYSLKSVYLCVVWSRLLVKADALLFKFILYMLLGFQVLVS